MKLRVSFKHVKKIHLLSFTRLLGNTFCEAFLYDASEHIMYVYNMLQHIMNTYSVLYVVMVRLNLNLACNYDCNAL